MISHAHNFIFVHIPKTGGTSVEHCLAPYGTVLQGREHFGSIYYKHATAGSLQKMLGPGEYARYFTFAFVRNPWDWIVSQYAFSRGFSPPYVFGTPYRLSGRVKPEHRDWPFADWLPWWIDALSPSQSKMLVGDEGQLIVDVVGRFENLEGDFHQICSTLGVPAAPLPRLKASERGAYAEYYDDTTRALVLERFKMDFELFGYPLEP